MLYSLLILQVSSGDPRSWKDSPVAPNNFVLNKPLGNKRLKNLENLYTFLKEKTPLYYLSRAWGKSKRGGRELHLPNVVKMAINTHKISEGIKYLRQSVPPMNKREQNARITTKINTQYPLIQQTSTSCIQRFISAAKYERFPPHTAYVLEVICSTYIIIFETIFQANSH